MDLKDIIQIVDLMKRSDLTEFEIEEEGFKLRISRGKGEQPAVATTGTAPPFPPVYLNPSPQEPPPSEEKGGEEEEDKSIAFIKSPMVGTFYRAPSSETPPFVEEGQQIKEESVVCIIEAMKVMNEIQAEMTCAILEILVENGQSVEFGQPLFKVKTD